VAMTPPEEYLKLDPAQHLERARRLAEVAHAGFVNDKNGEDYIKHPARVAAHAARLAGQSSLSDADQQHAVAVAWLHDTIEDTPITDALLAELGFPDSVVRGVVLLTRSDGVPDADYYAGIADNPVARIVKLADLADNTDPNRLAILGEKDQVKLCKKYARAFAALGEKTPAHVAAKAN